MRRTSFLAYFVADAATLANAVCGMLAVLFLVTFIVLRNTSETYPLNYLTLVWVMLLFAAIFDALDGFVARRLKASSELGKELDSLSDAVAFGAAPALIIAVLNSFGDNIYWLIFSWACAIAYLCCALFRLARFDAEALPAEKYTHKFKGLPSPTAAGMVAVPVMLYVSLHDKSILLVKMLYDIFSEVSVVQSANYLTVGLPFLGLLLAYLMISDLEFVHFSAAVKYFKTRTLPLQLQLFYVVILILLTVLMREMIMMFLPLPFFLYGPINYLRIAFKRAGRG